MSRIWNFTTVFLSALTLRVVMLIYGLYQDATSPFKYTDIDYFVFTDASRFVYKGGSPYERETYRYTPLLSWLLLPTAFDQHSNNYIQRVFWFSFGKMLFAIGDLVAGWLSINLLVKQNGMDKERALKHVAGIWLLNPMVATISTRGSSEGLLGVMVIALLWAVMKRRVVLAGALLGLGTHFKIYPAIYTPSIVWWMDSDGDEVVALPSGKKRYLEPTVKTKLLSFFTMEKMVFGSVAAASFLGLNVVMYKIYGYPFVLHTYLYHGSRVDHRHNFSPYNILLYLVSSPSSHSSFPFASIPFLPQLFLSGALLPLAFAKWDLASTMFAQTFAFVTFNKVCTSQYFMWYIVLLPFYLPTSSLLSKPFLGATLGILWVAAQAHWLQQGYLLEFLGISTFFPGLWGASIFFFGVNIMILCIVVSDMRTKAIRMGLKSRRHHL